MEQLSKEADHKLLGQFPGQGCIVTKITNAGLKSGDTHVLQLSLASLWISDLKGSNVKLYLGNQPTRKRTLFAELYSH